MHIKGKSDTNSINNSFDLTAEVGDNLKGFLLSHYEANLEVDLMPEQLHDSSASLLPFIVPPPVYFGPHLEYDIFILFAI